MSDVIKALVERNRDSVIKRLPTYLRPEHFFQLCYTLDRDKKVAAIAQSNPDSVLSAIFKAADCGLTIGGAFQHCYVIPYPGSQEVNFQVGWRGFVFQWLHAGAVLKVVSQVVYLGDEIEIMAGDTEGIMHKPNLSAPERNDPKWMSDKRNIVGSYAIAWLPTGLKQYRWVPLGMIEQARSRSQNANGPAWRDFYPSMAAKTAVRRLDGLIQVCGPTPENREAWDRYARTIELDRTQFRIDDNDPPDDLPGIASGRVSPPSSAAAEDQGTEGGSTPPTKSAGRTTTSAAPPLPSLKIVTPEPEPAADDDPIDDERWDELIELAGMSGMKISALKKLATETYGLANAAQLRQSQADQLAKDLKQRAVTR
jgi:phage RecT family recombinase